MLHVSSMRSAIPGMGPLSLGLDISHHREDEYITITRLSNHHHDMHNIRYSPWHHLDKAMRLYSGYGYPISMTRPWPRPPRKKALIIGINYDLLSPKDDWWSLSGPQKDALAFKELLMRKYTFNEKDIVVMIDRPGEAQLAPTKANILREIGELVKGARSGDSFVFHFAGHSGQIVSEDNDEDDGMDEVLLPMDHGGLEKKESLIVDNDLRKYLVDPLPIGARLTAIFDSCHSGTLLDLDHYECNEVYFPWLSKGPRKYRSRWVNNVRKNTLCPTSATARILQTKRISKDEIQARDYSVDLEPSRPGSRGRLSLSGRSKSIHSPQQDLPSLAEVLNGDTNLPRLVSTTTTTITTTTTTTMTGASSTLPPTLTSSTTLAQQGRTLLTKDRKPPRINTNIHPRSNPHSRAHTHAHAQAQVHTQAQARILEQAEICMSPSPMRKCTGQCELEGSPTEKPTVVSISACKDAQISWESCDGASMTQILIKVLEQDPHPTFHDLMSKIGHSLHEIANQLHSWSQKEHLKRRKHARKTRAKAAAAAKAAGGPSGGPGSETPCATTPDELFEDLEVNNFWDPQLGSQKPLNKAEFFTM